jgi:hypothetical protein
MPLGRVFRRMLFTTLAPTSIAALVSASLSSIPTTMIAAAPIGPETVVSVRSPVFGLNGHVVGGDAVLAAFLDLGTAPVQKVILPGTNLNDPIFLTPTSSVAGGVANPAGFVLPPDFPAFEPQFAAGSGVLGGEGTMFMGLALLTDVNQPLSDVLGVRVPFLVRIADTSGFIFGSDGGLFITDTMSLGGAADFAPTLEPITLLLFGTTAAGLALHRWRQRRTKQTAMGD